MNQPESRDQALLRARRLHWVIGHSSPKLRTRKINQADGLLESFFLNQGAPADTGLSSSGGEGWAEEAPLFLKLL